MAYLVWYYPVFLVGISIFLAANDTCHNGNGRTGETVGGRDRCGESSGIPDEALPGQVQADGCAETRFHDAGRAQNFVTQSKELLRIVYPCQ